MQQVFTKVIRLRITPKLTPDWETPYIVMKRNSKNIKASKEFTQYDEKLLNAKNVLGNRLDYSIIFSKLCKYGISSNIIYSCILFVREAGNLIIVYFSYLIVPSITIIIFLFHRQIPDVSFNPRISGSGHYAQVIIPAENRCVSSLSACLIIIVKQLCRSPVLDFIVPRGMFLPTLCCLKHILLLRALDEGYF